MPKIIPELKERFLEAARRRLREDEAHDFTIRQVAEDCRTAVGTVYNYFPSKDALLVAVMMDDWQACCRAMRADAHAMETPLEALKATTAALRRFTRRYAPTWRHYSARKNSMSDLNLRHQQVIALISEAAGETLERFRLEHDVHLPEVLAELILMASRTDDGFERIAPALEKILRP